MKRFPFFHLLLAVTLVLGGAVGCKKKAKSPTPITSGQVRPVPQQGLNEGPDVVRQLPPENGGVSAVPVRGGPGNDGGGLGPVGGGPGGDPGPVALTDLRAMKTDESFFRANTVYFDFDRSTIKASEQAKVEGVARHLAANSTHAVRVAGHCDERGTEGYNLALGERRALAVREYLMNLGVPAERIDTISYGESVPAVPGSNEAAWKQNRRGEFILLTP